LQIYNNLELSMFDLIDFQHSPFWGLPIKIIILLLPFAMYFRVIIDCILKLHFISSLQILCSSKFIIPCTVVIRVKKAIFMDNF